MLPDPSYNQEGVSLPNPPYTWWHWFPVCRHDMNDNGENAMVYDLAKIGCYSIFAGEHVQARGDVPFMDYNLAYRSYLFYHEYYNPAKKEIK
jgi:hypothetical protein